MPATSVNFLNDQDSSSIFDFAGEANDSNFNGHAFKNQTEEDVYVELGCKVFEVNKVLYKSSDARRKPPP